MCNIIMPDLFHALALIMGHVKEIGWGDGKSQNDVSPNEFSETPGPQNESSQKRNVSSLIRIHPFHYESHILFV